MKQNFEKSLKEYKEKWESGLSSDIAEVLERAKESDWAKFESSLLSVHYKLNDPSILGRSKFKGIEREQLKEMETLFYAAKRVEAIPQDKIDSIEQILLGVVNSIKNIREQDD